MTGERRTFAGGLIELRCGDYRDALVDVDDERAAVICDGPYGKRTHDGQRTNDTIDSAGRQEISYSHWGQEEIAEFVARWAAVPGWVVPFCSHDQARLYEDSLASMGRYVFAPVPAVIRGMTCRLAGDGPSSWTTWTVPSRPRSLMRWGTLPGAYVGPAADHFHIGGKPIWLMRALVRDYSRHGDLIVDPCAGGGTTLIAAALEGRRAIGAELDPETFEKTCKRIAQTPITTPLFVAERPAPKQGGLF